MQILIFWLEMDWKTITRFSNKRTEMQYVAFWHEHLSFLRYPLEQCVHEPERQKNHKLHCSVCVPNNRNTCVYQTKTYPILSFWSFEAWIYSLWNNVCMNYRRRTTKTVHRISIPRMIFIIRQVLKRILRCSLRIVKPCLALLLCSYQIIMTPNDQIKAKAVEHNDLEGKQLSFICNKIVLMPDKFQWYFLLFC